LNDKGFQPSISLGFLYRPETVSLTSWSEAPVGAIKAVLGFVLIAAAAKTPDLASFGAVKASKFPNFELGSVSNECLKFNQAF
jgi:hypothetical protein